MAFDRFHHDTKSLGHFFLSRQRVQDNFQVVHFLPPSQDPNESLTLRSQSEIMMGRDHANYSENVAQS